MKYLKLAACMAFIWAFLPGLAMADIYVEFGGGMNVRGADDNDVIGTIEVGVDPAGPMRFGVQLSERVDRQSLVTVFDPCEDIVGCTDPVERLVDVFDSSTAAAIAMAYVNLGPGKFSPYLGAGAGFIIEDDQLDKPVGQFAAGLEYNFNDRMAVTGGYTYFSDFDGYESGGVLVGMRRTF